MSVSEKYAIINGKNMNVYTQEQLFNNGDSILENENIAVELELGGDNYILPVRTGAVSDKPGVYYNKSNPYAIISRPTTEEDIEAYRPNDNNIVDFKNATGIQDVVTMKEKLNSAMNQYLETDPEDGNTFRPPFLDTDSPEIRALKHAIIEKHVDVDKYAERFGVNWPNDKRKLRSDAITMFLLKRSIENFDLKMDLVISDASPDVPNPMNKTISINLCPGNDLSAVIEDVQKTE